ncbi:hypothetical protein [Xanthocytophaga flava]|uniref:hypothetical protein n=1 Tax=Xanthocytophaga flava TaxID=3048013 RepID=UPI0028D1F860|nr:hypothetical protein [Xanthocytophaga flavus]MDJ1471895.1 hypothetical protein [Xanthocytophaga flavus]
MHSLLKKFGLTAFLCLTGFGIYWFYTNRCPGKKMEFDLYGGMKGDTIQVFVNEELLIKKEFETDTIAQTHHRKYIFIASERYCTTDSLIKIRLNWNSKFDTIFYYRPDSIKIVTISAVRGMPYEGTNPFTVISYGRKIMDYLNPE